MATEKNINARIILKHDTEANWSKATTFVPKKGELILYDPDTTYNYTRIKIGDGSTKVSALPFWLTAGSNITISNNTISSPSISITNGTATTPTGDTVAVISGETASGHTITNTKVNVATKDYVDRKSVAAVQYLGTVSNTNELAALNPNSVGDFCRVAAAFSSYHAGDLLLCKTLKTSSAAATWDVIHGEIDKDTWTANSKNAAGYVAAGGSNANKVWKTDASGNPAWRDDANTNTAHTHTVGTGLNIDGSGGISGTTKYSLKVASSSEIGGVKPGTTSGKTYGVAVASDGAMTVNVPWTDTNTDTKVTQTAVTASDYTNWRPLVIGSSNDSAEGFSPSSVTDGVYTVNTITCQPSSGTIRATTFKGNASTATKATQDGNGNVIESTYAKKSHKHSVTAAGTNSSTSITPAGTVSQPTFTGTAASHNHTFTGTAAEHNHTFTGTQATASVKYTPAGTVSSSFTGTAHNHTFSGTPAKSGIPDTTNVTTIYSITGVGTLPSASLSSGTLPSCSYTAPSHTYTAPSLTGSVSNQCLTLTFNAGSHSFNAGSHSFSAGAFPTLTFNAGTLPTREAVSMPNTNHTHSVTATGTIGNATAGGSVSSTFAGTEATISHTFTPAGSISKTSITPAGTISSKELTPAGTVSKPTFTGTAASHTHTFTGSAVNSATES